MKLKHIIPSFLAALTFVLVGCSEDDEKTVLDGLRVSQSYVSIDENGGSTTITVNANADWTFKKVYDVTVTVKDEAGNTLKNSKGKDSTVVEKKEAPAWLTVTPVSGAAGETEVTFAAESTLDGRTATLELVSGGNTQLINIVQGESKISDATCAEVMEGPESKTYRVKGVVTKINNKEYGNWYLDDGTYPGFAATTGNTNGLYIYGTLDKNGKSGKNNSIDAWGIEEGDEITVEGPKTVYNGTVELVNVTVVKINKSLIKCDSLSIKDGKLSHEGGDITAFLTCKGNGIMVEVPEDAQEWLSIVSITTNSVKFHVAANDGDSRKTTLTFKTNDGSKEYTAQATINQDSNPSAPGTQANPFTVEQVREVAAKLNVGETSEQDYYIKGKISSIKYTFSAQYGTARFNISDDGTTEGEFLIFGTKYLGNRLWVEGDTQIALNDEVIICGKITNYNGTRETANEQNYIYSLNGATE